MAVALSSAELRLRPVLGGAERELYEAAACAAVRVRRAGREGQADAVKAAGAAEGDFGGLVGTA
jgi:hypothetical protein